MVSLAVTSAVFLVFICIMLLFVLFAALTSLLVDKYKESKAFSQSKVIPQVLEESVIPTLILEYNFTVVFQNQASKLIYGNLETKNFLGLLENEYGHEKILNSLYKTNKFNNIDIKIKDRNNSVRNILCSGMSFYYRGKKSILLTQSDVTSQSKNSDAFMSLINIMKYPFSDSKKFLDFVIDETVKLTDSKIGYIFSYDAQNKKFFLTNWSKHPLKSYSLDMLNSSAYLEESNLLYETMKKGVPIIINNIKEKNGNQPSLVDTLSFHSFMSIPIFSSGKIIAVACFANKSDSFTTEDSSQILMFMDGAFQILQRVKTEEELKISETKLNTIYNSVSDSIFVLDIASEKILDANARACTLYGYEKNEFFSLAFSDLIFCKSEAEKENSKAQLQKALTGELSVFECQAKKKDGTFFWAEVLLSVATFGDVKCFVASVINISDRKELEKTELHYQLALKREAEARALAETDPFTGVYNKLATEENIKLYLQAQGAIGKHALLMIDIDYFKNINDKLGHTIGDMAISDLAFILKNTFRNEDIIGRVGGDEFIVFMKNYGSVDIVRKKIELISKLINKTYSANGIKCILSVSVGVSFYPENGSDFKILYEMADKAMYESKNKGRNTYTLNEIG